MATYKHKSGRLLAITLFAVFAIIMLSFVARHPGSLHPPLIKAGAFVGLIVTGYLAWWAIAHRRLPTHLALIISANVIAFFTILAPFSGDKDPAYKLSGLMYLLSFVVRVFNAYRLRKG